MLPAEKYFADNQPNNNLWFFLISSGEAQSLSYFFNIYPIIFARPGRMSFIIARDSGFWVDRNCRRLHR